MDTGRGQKRGTVLRAAAEGGKGRRGGDKQEVFGW